MSEEQEGNPVRVYFRILFSMKMEWLDLISLWHARFDDDCDMQCWAMIMNEHVKLTVGTGTSTVLSPVGDEIYASSVTS